MGKDAFGRQRFSGRVRDRGRAAPDVHGDLTGTVKTVRTTDAGAVGRSLQLQLSREFRVIRRKRQERHSDEMLRPNAVHLSASRIPSDTSERSAPL